MQIIFYKDNTISSAIVKSLVDKFSETMKASVLTVENDKNMPTPSVIVKDDYQRELFRSGDFEAIKHLLSLPIANFSQKLTPSVGQLKKMIVPGAIIGGLAFLGVILYKNNSQQKFECECD